jgi:DNA-binding NtrC family response regulator
MSSSSAAVSAMSTGIPTTAPLSVEERVRIGLLGELRFHEQVQAFADSLINATLLKYQGNQYRAAQALGMHRNTLSRRIDDMRDRKSLRASLRHSDYRKLPQRVTV